MSKNNLSNEDRSLWGLITRTVRPLGVKGPMPFFGSISAKEVKPSVRPWSPVLDLHGMTLHDAHRAVREHIRTAERLCWRRITIITGLSGDISKEFPVWLSSYEIDKFQTLSGGGAYEIWLRKH